MGQNKGEAPVYPVRSEFSELGLRSAQRQRGWSGGWGLTYTNPQAVGHCWCYCPPSPLRGPPRPDLGLRVRYKRPRAPRREPAQGAREDTHLRQLFRQRSSWKRLFLREAHGCKTRKPHTCKKRIQKPDGQNVAKVPLTRTPTVPKVCLLMWQGETVARRTDSAKTRRPEIQAGFAKPGRHVTGPSGLNNARLLFLSSRFSSPHRFQPPERGFPLAPPRFPSVPPAPPTWKFCSKRGVGGHLSTITVVGQGPTGPAWKSTPGTKAQSEVGPCSFPKAFRCIYLGGDTTAR